MLCYHHQFLFVSNHFLIHGLIRDLKQWKMIIFITAQYGVSTAESDCLENCDPVCISAAHWAMVPSVTGMINVTSLVYGMGDRSIVMRHHWLAVNHSENNWELRHSQSRVGCADGEPCHVKYMLLDKHMVLCGFGYIIILGTFMLSIYP